MDDIIIKLDIMMTTRRMSLNELAEKVGVSITNLSLLKNNRVKSVRFSTLKGICRVLECQPGDILEYKEVGNEPAIK